MRAEFCRAHGASNNPILEKSMKLQHIYIQGSMDTVSRTSRSARKSSLETISEKNSGSRESEAYTSTCVARPQHPATIQSNFLLRSEIRTEEEELHSHSEEHIYLLVFDIAPVPIAASPPNPQVSWSVHSSLHPSQSQPIPIDSRQTVGSARPA